MKKKILIAEYISDVDVTMNIKTIFSDRGGVVTPAEHRG